MAVAQSSELDDKVNAYLAALPTPNKLWLILVDEDEASIFTSDTLADLTQSGATPVVGVAGLSCVDGNIDLGGPHEFSGTNETPRAVVACTDDPANVGASWYVANNLLPAGAAYNFATDGPCFIDTLQIAEEGSASA